MMRSINPATAEEFARFPTDDSAALERTLAAAAAAQALWRTCPMEERSECLQRLAVALRRNKAAHAALISREMGKPLFEADAEIEKAAMTCEYYAATAPAQLGPVRAPWGATESSTVFDPLGVVLAIMPWNYPVWQVVRAAAPALAAGNGMVLKHAANVTQCALALRSLFEEAGAPAGLFGVVLAEPVQVEGLIADPRIAAVTLTGSTEVGAIVAAQAGRALKKQVLELGGSDPFVVLRDADIAAAAKVAVKARFTNAGQSCVNAKRFIVEAEVAEAFTEAFARETARLVVGDPFDAAVTMGPLARANLRDGLHRQVEASLAAGARLVAGGEPIEGPGFFYPPTILDAVTPGMAAFDEETFGPVAAIVRAPSEAAALELANQTIYGLGATIWSQDVERAEHLARRLDAGVISVNGMVASDPRLPFGGVKKSGYGRELGEYGIREFTNVKSITVASRPAPTPATGIR